MSTRQQEYRILRGEDAFKKDTDSDFDDPEQIIHRMRATVVECAASVLESFLFIALIPFVAILLVTDRWSEDADEASA